MRVFELFFFFRPFFKLLVTLLEETLTTELLSKNVELTVLPVGIFIFSAMHVYYGKGGIIVWHPIYIWIQIVSYETL